MSMEVDSQPPPTPVSHKTTNEGIAPSKTKKRKRANEDDSGISAHSKKHRSKRHKEHTSIPTQSTRPSSFYQQTSSLYLPLAPIAQHQPLQGLCAEHLSPLILTYYPPLDGVVLSYDNARLSERPGDDTTLSNVNPALARSVDEYAVSFIWLTANFLVFRPTRGDLIQGWVNLQNEGSIGLVCWNFFNSRIERSCLPSDWTWKKPGGVQRRKSMKLKRASDDTGSSFESTEGPPELIDLDNVEGHFVDGIGKKVEGLLEFRVKGVETSKNSDRDNGFLGIEGTMLDLEEEQLPRNRRKLGKKSHRKSGGETVGALTNGHTEDRHDEDGSPSTKHGMNH